MTDSESNRETKKPRPAWLDWLQIFAVAAVLAFVLNTFLIANARVPTGSMITTIMPGDRVIGSRLSIASRIRRAAILSSSTRPMNRRPSM